MRGLRHNLRERDLCHPFLGSGLTQQGHAEEQPQIQERQDLRHTSAKLHTKRPTAPVCCTNGSRAHTISCLGVGAWLKVNTRALGRGALHKVDSIPLSLTSEHHRASVVSLLGSPPQFSSYHIIEHASCIPYKPSTPVNHYIYRISQTGFSGSYSTSSDSSTSLNTRIKKNSRGLLQCTSNL